jgi:hypothetical protein
MSLSPKLCFDAEERARVMAGCRGSSTAGMGAFPSATRHGGQALGTRDLEEVADVVTLVAVV